MKKATWGIAAAVAALLAAGSAGAQVCAGYPTAPGQGTLGALANLPSGYRQYGGEGSYNMSEAPLAFNGGILVAVDDGSSLVTLRGGVALKVDSIARLRGISICPNLRVDFSAKSGFTLWQVPIGLGVGATLPLGAGGTSLSPYVIPALVWEQLNGGPGTGVTETHFGVRGGADLGVGRVYVGGMVEWVSAPGTEAMFGVRAGVRL